VALLYHKVVEGTTGKISVLLKWKVVYSWQTKTCENTKSVREHAHCSINGLCQDGLARICLLDMCAKKENNGWGW
jgi:hypothetical protein